jgi:hypothetical protein
MRDSALQIIDLDSPGHEVVLWQPPAPVEIVGKVVETKPARRRQTVVAKPKRRRAPRWTFRKNGFTWCIGCRCLIQFGRCANLQCGNYREPGSVTRRQRSAGDGL